MLRSFVASKNLNRVQLLIIAGVVVASLYLAIVSARAYQLESLFFHPVLLLLVGAIVTLLLIARPIYGLVILIVFSIFSLTRNPYLTRYVNPAILIISLLLVLWVLDRGIVKRRLEIIPARPFLPLLLLVIAATISFGVGQLRWFAFARPAPLSAQLAGLMLFYLSAGAFFLAAHQITEYTWLKRLTWLFLALGGVYILIRLIPGRNEALWNLFSKATNTSVFWIFLVAFASSHAIFNKQLRMPWRITLASLTFFAFLIAMTKGYDWKSGWLPSLAALLVVIYFRSPKLAIAIAVVAGVFVLMRDLPSQVIQDDEYSYITRLAAWEIVLGKIYTVSPIFGLGPANYRLYTPLFSIMGYNNILFSSHNNYIDLLAQTGIIGLLAFLWFFFEVFRLGWRLYKQVTDGFARAYVIAALSGLVATLASGVLGDWIIPYVYNIGIHGFQGSLLAWFFLGGLVAIERMQQQGQVG